MLYGIAAGAGWLTTAPHAAGLFALHPHAAGSDRNAPAIAAFAMEARAPFGGRAEAGPAAQPPAAHGGSGPARPADLGARLASSIAGLLGRARAPTSARPPQSQAPPVRASGAAPARGGRGVQIQLSDQWPFRPDKPPAAGEPPKGAPRPEA